MGCRVGFGMSEFNSFGLRVQGGDCLSFRILGLSFIENPRLP